MKSLQHISSLYVGENADTFPLQALQDLPSHVFESILPYLSARKLQEVQETSKSGVDFEKVWKQHIRKRWQMGVQTAMNVFHQQDLQPDYHIVYMMQHFHDLLDVCTTHTFSVNSAEAVDQIMEMLSRHRLSHLVLNDLNLHESFFRKLILTLHHNYKKGKIPGPIIELLDFQSLSSTLEFDGSVPVDVCLMGVKSMDLSMNYLDDTVFSGLVYLIRNDLALVHLKLQECSLTETKLLQLLESLSGKKIRTLNMSGNVMETEEVEAALVKFMCRCESLTTLELNNICPRKNFIGSSHFIEAVVHHQSLTTLSLGNNHLEDEAVDFLKAVCCTDHRLSLKTLHIWFNWIKGESLLQAAHEIKKHHGNRGPVLDNLSITGNQMTYDLAQELCQVYSSIVKVLNAGRIEFSLPFAEYVAQM